MNTRKIHYISGLILTVFIGLHLYNHFCSIFGAAAHIEMMNTLRIFYRNVFVEIILLTAVLVQIFSGIKLFRSHQKTAAAMFDRLHVWTGLYLAAFLIIHVGAVLAGRYFLHLDTNFYFGVAGLNTFPFNLFFIPYYTLAVIAFFGHLAAVHSKRMKSDLFYLSPRRQAIALLFAGLFISIVLLYGLTNHFKGVAVPPAYNILVGK